MLIVGSSPVDPKIPEDISECSFEGTDDREPFSDFPGEDFFGDNDGAVAAATQERK